jgi:hypothetical protein
MKIIYENIQMFNYFWKYNTDNINNEIWKDWNDILISNWEEPKINLDI